MKSHEKWAFAIMGVTIIILGILVVQLYEHPQLAYSGTHRSLFSELGTRGPVTANDISLVAGWMTFDYINHLFALPTGYLQTTLDIKDGRYPRLAIEEYCEDANIKQASFIVQVQAAIRAYLGQATTTAVTAAATSTTATATTTLPAEIK